MIILGNEHVIASRSGPVPDKVYHVGKTNRGEYSRGYCLIQLPTRIEYFFVPAPREKNDP